MAGDRVAIANRTRSTPPRVPFSRMKRAVLGERYELSVALVGERRSRALNRARRGADKPATVLAFPLSSDAGELILTPAYIRKRAARYGLSYRHCFLWLVIHGLLHLKGYRHGSTMEKQERKLCQRFMNARSKSS